MRIVTRWPLSPFLDCEGGEGSACPSSKSIFLYIRRRSLMLRVPQSFLYTLHDKVVPTLHGNHSVCFPYYRDPLPIAATEIKSPFSALDKIKAILSILKNGPLRVGCGSCYYDLLSTNDAYSLRKSSAIILRHTS